MTSATAKVMQAHVMRGSVVPRTLGLEDLHMPVLAGRVMQVWVVLLTRESEARATTV